MPERASKGSGRGLSTMVAVSPCPLHRETTQVPPGGRSRPRAMSPPVTVPSSCSDPARPLQQSHNTVLRPLPTSPHTTPHRTSAHPLQALPSLPAQGSTFLARQGIPGVTQTEGKFPMSLQLLLHGPRRPPSDQSPELLPQGLGAAGAGAMAGASPSTHTRTHSPLGSPPPSLRLARCSLR